MYIAFKIAKDMERWAKSVNAAKAVQQQQLQAVIKAEAQVAASVPALLNSPSLITADLSTKSGIALTAALKEVSSETIALLLLFVCVGGGGAAGDGYGINSLLFYDVS